MKIIKLIIISVLILGIFNGCAMRKDGVSKAIKNTQPFVRDMLKNPLNAIAVPVVGAISLFTLAPSKEDEHEARRIAEKAKYEKFIADLNKKEE